MKVQNPIIGRARGSAGGMTFCKNYDKNVARAKAFEVSNPNTQAQQIQRAFFAELTALCTYFSEDQLRTLFPRKPKTMSRRNALSKQIAEYYVVDGTTKSIDIADIDTLGNAPVMDFGTTVLRKNRTELAVRLDESISSNQMYSDYFFVCVFFNATKKQVVFTLDSTTVEYNYYSIDYPPNWKTSDEISVIPFITNCKEDVSTKGFGSFIIKTRPEKKNR